jgi:tetratricopeptide (TPR) repeat protein
LQKALRRNKIAFAGTGAVVVALVLGVIISAWQAVRATRAKAVALVEKQRAAEQAAIATSITEYLQQMLGSVDPGAGKGLDYSVRQLLDDYAGDLEKHLPHQPEVEATLRTTIGKAYSRLGELDKARKHLMRALVLRRGVFGDKHEKYADSLVAYAWTVDFDRREFPEREADLRQALAIYRARGVGGEAVIRALFALQWILLEQAYAGMPDKWKEIEPVSNEALAEARKSPGVDSPDIARIQGGLVHAKIIQSQYDEAEEIARESLATRVRLYGPEHFETAWAYYILGEALRAEHKFAGAIQAEKQALTLMRKVFSPQQRNIATALNAVIRTLDLADHSHALADLFTSVTKLGELESVFRDVLSTTKPSKVDNDDPALVAVRGLAQFREFYLHLSHELAAAGKTREAEESRQKAIQVLESLQIQLAGNPDLLPYVYSYGSVALTKTGEPQQAKELIRKLLDPVTPKRGRAYNDVAWFLATSAVPAHRDPTLAIELAKKAVESNAQFSYYRNTLGVARYRAGDWKQAISDLEKSVSLGQGGNSFDFFFLAMAHWKLGDKDKALECYERAIPSMGKQQPNEELRRFQTEAEELMKESPVK